MRDTDPPPPASDEETKQQFRLRQAREEASDVLDEDLDTEESDYRQVMEHAAKHPRRTYQPGDNAKRRGKAPPGPKMGRSYKRPDHQRPAIARDQLQPCPAPDWAVNPALLPKRPPGRASGGAQNGRLIDDLQTARKLISDLTIGHKTAIEELEQANAKLKLVETYGRYGLPEVKAPSRKQYEQRVTYQSLGGLVDGEWGGTMGVEWRIVAVCSPGIGDNAYIFWERER